MPAPDSFGLPGVASAAAEARRSEFGALGDGSRVEAVELANGQGMAVRILALGASIQQLLVPDRHGTPGDVVLGYASAQQYLDQPQYFGATVGRYANRIAGGKFSLEGRQYRLETNDGPNHLHGGKRGFDQVLWKIESISSGSPARAVLTYASPDGEGGYPGKLRRRVYRQGDGFCLEPQAFPDAPNRADFPSARLNPGETYVNSMALRFCVATR